MCSLCNPRQPTPEQMDKAFKAGRELADRVKRAIEERHKLEEQEKRDIEEARFLIGIAPPPIPR